MSTVTEYRSDTPPTLAEAQTAVGGYVEVVRIDGRELLVNEEGLLRNLPVNREASALAGQHIVGDVVILEGAARGEW